MNVKSNPAGYATNTGTLRCSRQMRLIQSLYSRMARPGATVSARCAAHASGFDAHQDIVPGSSPAPSSVRRLRVNSPTSTPAGVYATDANDSIEYGPGMGPLVS